MHYRARGNPLCSGVADDECGDGRREQRREATSGSVLSPSGRRLRAMARMKSGAIACSS